MQFYKYQGTGNDFIILNGASRDVQLSNEQVAKLCDRRFGVGADGLMILQKSDIADFRMKYYNSDGNESSLCGNGSRCIVKFAYHKEYIGSETTFEAIDGLHKANILESGIVELEMLDVNDIAKELDDTFILNTGSPHYIKFENSDQDIVEFGRSVRYSDRFKIEGINVNLVKDHEGDLHIRTYERGVEAETLSCGTGVTAAAIAHAFKNKLDGTQTINVKAQGGELYVRLHCGDGSFTNIWLCGPAEAVFKGKLKDFES